MSESIEFAATIAKVQTLADQGVRVTFDLPEDTIIQAAWLMDAKRRGVVVTVSVVAKDVQ
jgi:hypothetical protein